MDDLLLVAVGFVSGFVDRYAVDRHKKLSKRIAAHTSPVCEHEFQTVKAIRWQGFYTGLYQVCNICGYRRLNETTPANSTLRILDNFPDKVDWDWFSGKVPTPRSPDELPK